VNQTGAFLVDTELQLIYTTQNTENTENIHHVMILLAFFILVSGLALKISNVAINCIKTRNNAVNS
jgi:hypothetical protein